MQCFSLLPSPPVPPGSLALSPSIKETPRCFWDAPLAGGMRQRGEKRWESLTLSHTAGARRGCGDVELDEGEHGDGFPPSFHPALGLALVSKLLSVLNLGAGACGRLGPVAVPWSRSRHLQQQVLLSPLPSTTQIYHTGEEKQCRELLLQDFEVHAPTSPCPMVQMSPSRAQPINHAQGPAGSSLPPPGASMWEPGQGPRLLALIYHQIPSCPRVGLLRPLLDGALWFCHPWVVLFLMRNKIGSAVCGLGLWLVSTLLPSPLLLICS